MYAVGNLHRIAHGDRVVIFRFDDHRHILVHSAGIGGSHGFSAFILDTVGEFYAQIAQIPRRVAGNGQLEIEELKIENEGASLIACMQMGRKKRIKSVSLTFESGRTAVIGGTRMYSDSLMQDCLTGPGFVSANWDRKDRFFDGMGSWSTAWRNSPGGTEASPDRFFAGGAIFFGLEQHAGLQGFLGFGALLEVAESFRFRGSRVPDHRTRTRCRFFILLRLLSLPNRRFGRGLDEIRLFAPFRGVATDFFVAGSDGFGTGRAPFIHVLKQTTAKNNGRYFDLIK